MRWFSRKLTELETRMLSVVDPVEMKCEPGTEIVVAATAEDFAADEGHHTMHVVRRIDETFMRGLGHKNHRTPTPAPSRR